MLGRSCYACCDLLYMLDASLGGRSLLARELHRSIALVAGNGKAHHGRGHQLQNALIKFHVYLHIMFFMQTEMKAVANIATECAIWLC